MSLNPSENAPMPERPTNLYESVNAFISHRHVLNYPGEPLDLYTINQSYFYLANILGVPPLTFTSYREATRLNDYLVPNKRDLTRRELAEVEKVFRQCTEMSHILQLQGKTVDLQSVIEDIDDKRPLELPIELCFLSFDPETFEGLNQSQSEYVLIKTFNIHGWETLTQHALNYVNQTQDNYPYNQTSKRRHIVRDWDRLYTQDPLINFFNRFFEYFLQMPGSTTLINQDSTLLHPLIDQLFEIRAAIKARIS